VTVRQVLADRDRGRADEQVSALRHRLLGQRRHAQQRLVELLLVGGHERRARDGEHDDVGAVARDAAELRHQTLDGRAGVDDLGLERDPSPERRETPRQRRDAVERAQHAVDVALRRRVGGGRRLERDRVPTDSRRRIVDLARDGGREPGRGVELAFLEHARVQFPDFGDVHDEARHVRHAVVARAHGPGVAHPHRRVVAAVQPVLERERSSRRDGAAVLDRDADPVVRVQALRPELRVGPPLVGRETEESLHARAAEDGPRAGVGRRRVEDGRRLLDEGAVPRLGAAQLLVALLDRLGHRVDRAADVAELAAAVRRTDARVEGAAFDPLRDGDERARATHDEQVARDPRDDERQKRRDRESQEIPRLRAFGRGDLVRRRDADRDERTRRHHTPAQRRPRVRTDGAGQTGDALLALARRKHLADERRVGHLLLREPFRIGEARDDDALVVEQRDRRVGRELRLLPEPRQPVEEDRDVDDADGRARRVDDGARHVDRRLLRNPSEQTATEGRLAARYRALEVVAVGEIRRGIERHPARSDSAVEADQAGVRVEERILGEHALKQLALRRRIAAGDDRQPRERLDVRRGVGEHLVALDGGELRKSLGRFVGVNERGLARLGSRAQDDEQRRRDGERDECEEPDS
jgi:hypothetical protein